MLPVGRKPVLEHIIEEMVQVGLTNLLIVISSSKEMIRSYFGDGSAWGARCEYIIQKEMHGSGDAVLLGEDWVNGVPFVVAWGDCIFQKTPIDPNTSFPLTRLINAFIAHQPDIGVLVRRVGHRKPDKPHRFRYFFVPAIPISSEMQKPRPFLISTILKNERAEPIVSDRFTASSRWLFSPNIFSHLRKLRAEVNSAEEVLLTDAAYNLVVEGGTVWGVPLSEDETIDDIGSWESYLSITAQMAVKDLEYGDKIYENLCKPRS